MTASDLSACINILLGYPWTRYAMTAERAERVLRTGLTEGADLRVSEDAEGVSGFLWLVPRGAFYHSGYIRLIGVAERAKGRGAGRALMAAAETDTFASAPDLFLLVSDFNLDAQAFYRHLGYAQVGVLPDYVLPGNTELIFRKRRPQTGV
jgi:ribosomal protein S18 acetylase RimI-like enzyme